MENQEMQSAGSLKNPQPAAQAAPAFLTREQAMRLTRKQLDQQPELVQAVIASMRQWDRQTV